MPPKKRAVVEDEEDSSQQGSPAPTNKRARTSGEVNGHLKGKGKGKAKAVDESHMDEDDDEDEDEDMEASTGPGGNQEELDKQFEDDNYDKIMASVKSREKHYGSIADYGIIEKVELYQFMCHQRLSFSFGPQINFIIGHNGSGKSAVLSAITIALGGKTTSTGRGNGLKAFIREGQNASEVSIQLKNRGDEAYRHREFGDSIIITRKFSTEGSSSWKIRSKDGKVISTKRDELSKICDHMNIQVDNPMTVLTQDASRVFLASSNPTERYNLFLKGTQLQQLSDEYSITLENIQSTSRVLDQKKEAIPDLREGLKEAKRKFEEAENARKQKAKQDDIKKELAWAHVKFKEDEFTAKLKDVATLEAKLPKIQAEIDTGKAKLNEVTETFTRREEAFAELGDINNLEARRADISNQVKTNKTKLAKLNADIKSMNTNVDAFRTTIRELDEQIERETQRLAKNTQQKRDQVQNQLAAMQSRVETHEATITTIQEQRQEYEAKKADAETQGRQLEEKQKELHERIKQQEQMIKNCEQAEKDNLLPYGRNIKGVLEQINRMSWHGAKPLGPLGVFAKAKDVQIWGDILRNQLGQFLMSFAITDPRDKNPLKDLLKQTQNNHVQIIISSTELFDYSAGEPPMNYLTILRALEISNPIVTRILVNNANIESRVLAKTRLEAQRSLEQLPKGGTANTLDGFTVRVFPDGVSSIPLDLRRRNNDSSNLMLTGRDSKNEIHRARQEIATLQQEITQVHSACETFRADFRNYHGQLSVLSGREQTERTALRNAQAECQKLTRELNEEMPTNISGFVDAKKETEGEIASILVQFEPLVQERNSLDQQQKQFLTEKNEVSRKINAFSEERNSIKRELEDAAEARVKAQQNVKHYEKRLQEAQQQVDTVTQAADVLQEEFAAWTDKATEYCERVENPRSVDDLQRKLESVEKALQERAKKHGASLEELEDLLLKAKEQYESARSNIRAMAQLIKKLRNSLIARYGRWEDFRRHIALRTKVVFQYHLSQRGYFGKLLFDHQDKMLVLKVQTDDQASQAGHKEKDPRSLSGGEKSFSTICLLLALWESIGCPIRCLDEFDVFMDAVNRRISMKMMIDTANASNQKQYILITPLEMANISFGNTVRVHKMSDPQRNQGTLGFS